MAIALYSQPPTRPRGLRAAPFSIFSRTDTLRTYSNELQDLGYISDFLNDQSVGGYLQSHSPLAQGKSRHRVHKLSDKQVDCGDQFIDATDAFSRIIYNNAHLAC